ncbi:MAG: hypothetical protein IKL66_03300 [Clostridia bacterium]|nr:hypothetical protein [Clostridia bacterium]
MLNNDNISFNFERPIIASAVVGLFLSLYRKSSSHKYISFLKPRKEWQNMDKHKENGILLVRDEVIEYVEGGGYFEERSRFI